MKDCFASLAMTVTFICIITKDCFAALAMTVTFICYCYEGLLRCARNDSN
jgi:hypothetical protein